VASHLRDVRSLTAPSPGRPGVSRLPAPATQAGTSSTGITEPDAEAFAAVLYFDDFTEKRVRQAWEALDQYGVPSAATTHEESYRPHITLAIVNTPYPEQAAARLRMPLSNVAGLPVSMTALGFFLTNKAPAYLSVAPTSALLDLHERVHAALGGMDSWAYYRPGNWMPHCTLAMDVTCQTTVAEALGETPLPIHATIGSAHMVELPGQPPAADASRPRAIRSVGTHRLPVEPSQPRRTPRREVGRRRRAI
jgi:2'-5' RNA ligase